MNPETLRILDSISRERNIDRETLIQDLEQAMISAARKHFNSLDTEEFGCAVDRLNGRIALWRNLPEGGREPIDLATLGRIPAQTAKQVMIQKFREGERQSLLEEFGKRQGELVTGTAHRADGGALIVQLERTEAIMPRSDQIPGEEFKPGDRVRCLIREVRDQVGGGGQIKIIVSRSHPDFIRKLFEAEVPEVAERIIEIKAMAREPGFRTKLAVASVDSKVDAVGACVGVRGSRIKNIVDELGGEKIDIVRWNESSQVLIANALKPAEVEEVSLCFELSRATIIVREDQLSLAIGRRGQNVRLAARLTGWDVDILTPAEFAKGLEILEQTVKPIEGVTEEMLDRMGALGIISVFDARDVGVDVLEKAVEMPAEVAERVVAICSVKAEEVAEQQKIEKAEFEARRSADSATAMHLLRGGPVVEPDAQAESLADEILGAALAPSSPPAEPAAPEPPRE
ncbi:MAG TPA: transcription termination factor NusA [Phycisphaerales bacterium]|nr:transcription termination factor NusA [Phycisphaerales bacterium]HMP36991.1 transcription termination factor NusA [Phycisphaerales bacterium]